VPLKAQKNHTTTFDRRWIDPFGQALHRGVGGAMGNARQGRVFERLAQQKSADQFGGAFAGLQRDIAVNPSVTITSDAVGRGISSPSTNPTNHSRFRAARRSVIGDFPTPPGHCVLGGPIQQTNARAGQKKQQGQTVLARRRAITA